MAVRLPGRRDRLMTAGYTGSGKTVANTWQLSKKDFRKDAWIYVDYKNDDDDIINQLRGVQHIDYSVIPKKPGLYALHPMPGDDRQVDDYLWRIWKHRHIGLYFDECLQVPSGKESAVRAILTQGRSLEIPVIGSTQRPVNVDRFFFSEAQFIQIYDLNYLDDWKTVAGFLPLPDMEWVRMQVRDYHSLYFDVLARKLVLFKPVPTKEEIFKILDAQLKTRKL